MIKKLIGLVVLIFALALAAHGQAVNGGTNISAGSGDVAYMKALPDSAGATAQATQPPATTPTGVFTISAGTASVNGPKGVTVPAAVILGLLQVTPNLRLRDDNILAPAVNYEGYFGGAEYSFLHLIKKSQLSPSQWDSYAVIEGGSSHVVPVSGPSSTHFGFLGGVGLRYDPSSTGHFSVTIGELSIMRAPGLVNGAAWSFRSSLNWKLNGGN